MRACEVNRRRKVRLAGRTPERLKRDCTAALLSWLNERDGEQVTSIEQLFEDPRGYQYGELFSKVSNETMEGALLSE